MQSILDEVYSTPEPLDMLVHAAYRMEVCYLLHHYPESESSLEFDLAYPLLQACESEDEQAQTHCSMRVAHQVSGIMLE
ncbi:hypothetical protein [Aliidiomarina soli]|nr:hypothetical protein [Aliidiomarina soli]